MHSGFASGRGDVRLRPSAETVPGAVEGGDTDTERQPRGASPNVSSSSTASGSTSATKRMPLNPLPELPQRHSADNHGDTCDSSAAFASADADGDSGGTTSGVLQQPHADVPSIRAQRQSVLLKHDADVDAAQQRTAGQFLDEIGAMADSREHSIEDIGEGEGPPPLLEDGVGPPQLVGDAPATAADENRADAIGEDLGLSHDQLLDIVDAPSSLFVFSARNKFRHVCLKLARHTIFKNCVLVLIILNSVFLAADQPAVKNPSGLDSFLGVMEWIFTIAFDLEALVKIVALGFMLHEGSYLRNGWNFLDFVIVVTSTIQLFGVGANYSALRVFRVLRPLRSVSRVKKLKHLIGGLFRALPVVLDNVLLMIFFMIVFAVAAVQLWMDSLSQRCYITEIGLNSTLRTDPSISRNLTLPLLIENDTDTCGGTRSCPATLLDSKVECQVHRDIYYRRNMNYDNIFSSFLLVMKIMALDNWPDNLHDAMNMSGEAAALFFILLTIVGSFYCINLFLAILTEGYSNSDAEGTALGDEDDPLIEEEQGPTSVRRLKDFTAQTNLDDPREAALLGNVRDAAFMEAYEKARAAQLAAQQRGVIQRSPRPSFATSLLLLDRSQRDDDFGIAAEGGGAGALLGPPTPSNRASTSADAVTNPFLAPLPHLSGSGSNALLSSSQRSDNFDLAAMPLHQSQDVTPERAENATTTAPEDDAPAVVMLTGQLIDGVPIEYFDLPHYTEVFTDDLDFASKAAARRKKLRQRELRAAQAEVEKEAREAAGANRGPKGENDDNNSDVSDRSHVSSATSASNSTSTSSSGYYGLRSIGSTESGGVDLEASTLGHEDTRHWLRVAIGRVVASKIVEWFMVVITLVNVIALSIDHYGIDETLSFALDIISIVCTAFFALEISAKLIAFGWKKVMSRGFNVLDFILVLASIPDIALSGGKASGFSAIRVFRLLRVLRLLKEIQSLQAVIKSVMHSIASVAYLSLLILLFLYVYAIMGMQLFGTGFGPNEETRDSFGTLWEALLLCFIVVTGEDWTSRMLIAMKGGTGDEVTAVLYFVSLFMIGNYIFINLFIAIILDKLAEKMEQISVGKEVTPPSLLLPPMKKQLLLRASTGGSVSGSRPGTAAGGMMGSPGGTGLSGSSRAGSLNLERQGKSVQFAVGGDTSTGERMLSRKSTRDAAGTGGGGTGSPVFILDPGQGSSAVAPDSISPEHGDLSVNSASSFAASQRGQKPPIAIPTVTSDASLGAGLPSPTSLASPATGQQQSQPQQSHPQQLHTSPSSFDLLGNESASPVTNRSFHSVQLSERRFIDEIESEALGIRGRLTRLAKYLSTVTPIPVKGHSLKIFSETNCFRRLLLTIIGARSFVICIDLMLVVNVIFLCFESPFLEGTQQTALNIADYVFTIAFAVEMIMKIVAFGAISPPGERSPALAIDDGMPEWAVFPAYFRDPWNCCDAVVTVANFIGLFVPVFRVFRSVRTIRLMLRVESMRIVIVALLQALPNILNGIVLGIFVFIVFGIMGVQFFKGKYYHCNDPAVTARVNCTGYYLTNSTEVIDDLSITSVVPRKWERMPNHFDHLGASILSIFVIAMGEAWLGIMYTGMDATEPDGGLVYHNQPWMAIYFVVVFIFTNFFAFNMIVGILINYFSKMKSENEGSVLLTPDQRLYIKAQSAIERAMFADELTPADNPLSRLLDRALTYRPVLFRRKLRLPLSEYLILFVVIVNVVFIAATHSTMSDEVRVMIDTVGLVCLILFTIEAAIKLVAYFPLQYFTQSWNTFDFIIISLGWLDVAIPSVPGLSFLRVLRVSKLVRGSGVEKLLSKTILSAGSFLNVIAVVILTFFIFAVAGVNIFGKVKLNGMLNQNSNFRNVPNAMLLLYQAVTTETWVDLMRACSIEAPDCDPSMDECGNEAYSVAYFTLFMILGSLTVLKLFTAVIVEIFTESDDGIDEVVLLFMEMRTVWQEHFGSRRIVHYTEFLGVIRYIPFELSELSKHPTRAEIIRLVSVLSLPIDSKFRVTYRDVVYALAWKKYKVEVRTLAAVVRQTLLSLMTKSFEVSQVWCADIIVKRFREHLARKHGPHCKSPRPMPAIEIVRDRSDGRTARADSVVGGAGNGHLPPHRGDSLQLPLPRKETTSSDGGITQEGSGAFDTLSSDPNFTSGGANAAIKSSRRDSRDDADTTLAMIK